MTLRELTEHYVKAFKNGPHNSETRKAYDTLKRIGEQQGKDLTNLFFRRLVEDYTMESHKYENLTTEKLNQAILIQYRSYIQQFQNEREEKSPFKRNVIKNKRRPTLEI